MYKWLIIALGVLIVGCNNEITTDDNSTHKRTTPISQLRNQAEAMGAKIITSDIVISGRVTSSDRDGNFFRSLIVEDESGAIEILIKAYDLATTYPEGLLVDLHLKGCAIAYDMGILQVGAKAEEYDYYALDYLETKQVIDRVIHRSTDVKRVEPRRCTIAEIKEEDCGRLVRVDNLTLRHSTSIDTLAGMTLNDATWQGYALFFDERGDSIAVYTAAEARFATEHIATTPLSLTGIVQQSKYDNGEECRHLKLRYASDYEIL